MRHILFFIKYLVFFLVSPAVIYGDAGEDENKEDRKKGFKAGHLWGKDGSSAPAADDEPADDEENDEEKNKNVEDKPKEGADKTGDDEPGGKKKDDKPEGGDEVTYTVGKDKFTEEQYGELLAKMVKHYELTEDEVESMSDKMLNRYLQDYNNLDKATKAANERHQNNAKDKRDISEEKQKLVKMREDIERESKTLEDKQKAVEAREKEIKDRLKTIDDEIDDEADDDKRQDLRLDKRDLNKELATIKNDKDELEKVVRKNQAKATAIYLGYVINNIQETSGISTARRVEDIIDEASKLDEKEFDKWMEKNGAEFDKAKLVNRIMNDYLGFMTQNPDSKMTPGMYFKLNKKDYPEAAPSDSKGDTKNNKDSKATLKDLSVKKALQSIIKKQKQQPPNPGGHPTDSTASDRNGKGPDKTKRKKAILSKYNLG